MNKVRNLIQLQIIAVISVLKQLYLTSPRESPTKRLGRQPIPEIHANNRDKRQNGFRSGPINALVALRRLRNDRFIADHCTRAYARIKKTAGIANLTCCARSRWAFSRWRTRRRPCLLSNWKDWRPGCWNSRRERSARAWWRCRRTRREEAGAQGRERSRGLWGKGETGKYLRGSLEWARIGDDEHGSWRWAAICRFCFEVRRSSGPWCSSQR